MNPAKNLQKIYKEITNGFVKNIQKIYKFTKNLQKLYKEFVRILQSFVNLCNRLQKTYKCVCNFCNVKGDKKKYKEIYKPFYKRFVNFLQTVASPRLVKGKFPSGIFGGERKEEKKKF